MLSSLSSVRSSRSLRSQIRNLFSQSQALKPEKPSLESDFKVRSPQSDQTALDQETVCETLSRYGNDWRRALEFFHWVETDCKYNHTTETFNRMINILGKFFEFDISWDLIRRMPQNFISIPNHATFRIMFKRYAAAHLVQDAIDTYDRLEEFGMRDETSYYNLIDALCEYKHVIEATELCLGKGKNKLCNGSFVVSETKIHNMILRGWFKMGWWRKCRDFWEEMDKKGVVKDLYSYSIYMDIVCKGGKPWKSVELYKEMKRKGIKLDVVVYNMVIRAIGLSQGVDFGIRVFREMRDLGCEPNVVTYNTVIKLLCENGRMKEAYAMLNEMSKRNCAADVITYQSFFACLVKPQEILRLFDRMVESGVRPKMDTYVMLMKKFGRWGFLRPVLMVWKKMEELGTSPDASAYNALIDALIQKGMLDTAKMYEEEMLEKGLSAKPRAELAEKLMEAESGRIS